jgi:3-methyladenine DNA glycosylase Tag
MSGESSRSAGLRRSSLVVSRMVHPVCRSAMMRKQICHVCQHLAEIPVTTPEAEAMSRDLKKRGFKFVRPTICYSLMQAVGMINDHVVDCYRYRKKG